MSRQRVNAGPQWRYNLVVMLLLAFAALLVWRVMTLQVLDTEKGHRFLQGQGDARTLRSEPVPAFRGVITDRHGEPLAVSTPVMSIWINPVQLNQAESQWPALAEAAEMPLAALRSRILDNSQREFVYLGRHLAPEHAEKIMRLGIPGVYRQREYKRFYPASEVTSQLVGFTNIDDKGQEGIELVYESWLRGEAGSKKVIKDLVGNVIREVGEGKSAQPGKTLQLSIDLRLQYLAYRQLQKAIVQANASSGSVVVLDSQTGEILAMVNQPSFNPNNRRNLAPAAIRNRAITDIFEPGSTVKPMTMVAALETGRYHPATVLNTAPGYIRVGGKTLLDPVNYGALSLREIIAKSSQVGITKLALDIEHESIASVFERFGLGEATNVGFPGESAGSLPSRSRWRPIEQVNFAFGYGLSVTPLQLAQAYLVFANEGLFKPVTLLKQQQPVAGERVVDAGIARKVVDMLQAVTEEGGTGTNAQIPAYTVAGKTGTVHKVGASGYADDRYIAVFAGLAPVANPRIVTVVTIDEPKNGKYYGGEIAAPVFAGVVADALRLLNVPPDRLEGQKTVFAKSDKPRGGQAG